MKGVAHSRRSASTIWTSVLGPCVRDASQLGHNTGHQCPLLSMSRRGWLGLAGPDVQSARLDRPRGCCMIPTKTGVTPIRPHREARTTLSCPGHPPTQPRWCCTGDPVPWASRAPGYSRQNLRKSDCSSFRAFRNILPFSVPTTKALSSCTATQATSAFSLESAEHCGGSRGCEPGKVPHPRTPPRQLWGQDMSSGERSLLQPSRS